MTAVRPPLEPDTAQPDGERGDRLAEPLPAQGPRFAELVAVIRKGCPPIPLIAAALVVSLLEVASTLAFPVITRDLIDRIASLDMSVQGLAGNPQIQLLIGILVLGALAGGVSTFLLARAGVVMMSNLRVLLIRKLLAQPVAYFDRHQSGEHASRVTKDADSIANLVTTDLQHLVTGVLLMIGSAVVLSLLDLKLTLTVFGIVLAAFVIMAPILAGMAKLTINVNDRSAALTGALARTFSEIRLVKAFTAEPSELERSKTEVSHLYRYSLKSAKIQASLQPMMSLALTLSILAIFVYGGGRVAMGTLSTGTLTAFILYIFNIVAPLIQLSVFLSNLQAAKGASLRIADILSQPGEDYVWELPASLMPAKLEQSHDLTFEGVRLTYEASNRTALSIDHLVVPANRRLAIIGPSGSGKTTILSLIERFYLPTHGKILWGDLDIAQVPLSLWRSLIGYVPQSTVLMGGTVRDNIGYGLTREVGTEELEAAAEAANCIDFIREMPDGFDSQVGDGGNSLSGGQRQRIAIARLFLRNPRILLMDEATASLDGESEAIVLAAVAKLMAGRTALVVTHRWATIQNVDLIAVVEGGEVREFGSASDMIRNSSYCNRVRARSLPSQHFVAG